MIKANYYAILSVIFLLGAGLIAGWIIRQEIQSAPKKPAPPVSLDTKNDQPDTEMKKNLDKNAKDAKINTEKEAMNDLLTEMDELIVTVEEAAPLE